MDPYRPLDDDARALARALLTGAASGALGTLRDGGPWVTRAACLWLPGQGMTLLLSDLSDHAANLAADSACSLLVGEAGAKGDSMTHARLTLAGHAIAVDKAALRDDWLASRPKTTLYFDFSDFRLVRLDASGAALNAGFGRAYRLTPGDLAAAGG